MVRTTRLWFELVENIGSVNMKLYEEMVQKSYGYETNHCTVIALAISSGSSFPFAHLVANRVGRKAGRGTLSERLIAKYNQICEGNSGFKRMSTEAKTLRTFARQNPEGRFYVNVSKHALAIVDGEIQDWTSKHDLKRVKEVWMFEEKIGCVEND